MKNMVNFMKSVYLNRTKDASLGHTHNINYWCPTGMNPIINQPELDY